MSKEQLAILRAIGRILRERNIPVTQRVPEAWEELVRCLEDKESFATKLYQSPGEWDSIETAPMDGTPIRVKRDTFEAIVSWSDELQAWVTGLATEADHLAERVLPWKPTSWAPMPGALE
jgi:hypothetical protein